METVSEEILIYSLALIAGVVVFLIYLRKIRKNNIKVREKIALAREEGTFEPVSLHPVVDPGRCIQSGACVAACPEKDILGILNGKATTINASRCVGHGACFHACPTQAITLCIGTEQRGVDLPQVNSLFESNVKGIFIAGELGGMGLIKNAVEQGKQATRNLSKSIPERHSAGYDLVIVGAGPAGIAASLTAKSLGLNFLTLEQDTLGGTVYTFPRQKVVMTSAMDLPLYGKVKLKETTKGELLQLWNDVLSKQNITIREHCRVEQISREKEWFAVNTATGESITTCAVLLAIGRRGSPRKLGVPGEEMEKVAYRLLEPENVHDKKILVVGGGDSAIESALLLQHNNHVSLVYRGEAFARLKPANMELIRQAMANQSIQVMFRTNPVKIEHETVLLQNLTSGVESSVANDFVYIFAGGELPSQFLEKTGIVITKKFGEAILTHHH